MFNSIKNFIQLLHVHSIISIKYSTIQCSFNTYQFIKDTLKAYDDFKNKQKKV